MQGQAVRQDLHRVNRGIKCVLSTDNPEVARAGQGEAVLSPLGNYCRNG